MFFKMKSNKQLKALCGFLLYDKSIDGSVKQGSRFCVNDQI